jgi:hypothetical protein
MESLFLAGPHFMCSIFASCLLIPSLTIPGLYYSTPKYFLIYMSVSTPRGNLLFHSCLASIQLPLISISLPHTSLPPMSYIIPAVQTALSQTLANDDPG